MTQGDAPVTRLDRHAQAPEKAGLAVFAAIVTVPALVGVAMGISQRSASGDFYATSAQVIATLFIAIAVDAVRQAGQRQVRDAVSTLVLMGQSWIGFFACIRALAGGASDLTVALAGVGVTAAALLLSWSLYEQIAHPEDSTHQQKLIAAALVVIFLFTAVALLCIY